MGGATCFVYVFAALAPFLAMNVMHMDASHYGWANLLPPVGLLLGSVISAQLSKKYKATVMMEWGIGIALIGSMMMFIFLFMAYSVMVALFIPMVLVFFGLALLFANASALAMHHTSDKAHGSAVMNFINMGVATIVVLSLGSISMNLFLLPMIYIGICLGMGGLNRYVFMMR